MPDGQGQILLSNMDTWAPERQLSKSCVRLASKNSPDLNKAAIRHFCLLNPLDFCQFTFQTMETIILITMLFDFSSVMNPDSSHHFMFSVFGHHSAASYISLAGHFAKVHVAPHQRGAQSRPAASSDQGPWNWLMSLGSLENHLGGVGSLRN